MSLTRRNFLHRSAAASAAVVSIPFWGAVSNSTFVSRAFGKESERPYKISICDWD
ncbi:MAG: twin-arginine translocation signal domain-containing protein, partial [Thermoguttaceae bacterium]